MNKATRDRLFRDAKAWVYEAAERIKVQMNDPLIIRTKSNPRDLVTTVDQETERFFAYRIRENYPEHFLISEEGFGDSLTELDGTVWFIDPIDGTTNFVNQQRNFVISLGIYKDGIGEIALIYDVMRDLLYSAKRGEGALKNGELLRPLRTNLELGQALIGMNNRWLIPNQLVRTRDMQRLVENVRATRSYGSAALEFAYVAEGVIDAYLTISLAPWDFAAGMILVNEVSGITTNVFGEPIKLLERNSVFVCNERIHQKVLNEYLLKGKK